jgi:hypothetical protein
MGAMARPGRFRPGAFGIALTLYDVWRRLPPKQRRQVLEIARTQGPKAAAKLLAIRRASRSRR